MKTVVRMFALVALAMLIAPAGGATNGISRNGIEASPRLPAPALTLEEQVAMLQKQVQALQGQVAALQSALVVTPTGTTLQGPAVSIISRGGTLLKSQNETTIETGSDMKVRASAGLSLRAGSTAELVSSAPLTLSGSRVGLNGGARPLATVGSVVNSGAVATGSATVFTD